MIEHDLTTGAERIVLRDQIDGAVYLSPDGNYLALTKSDPASKSNVLLRVSTHGGEVKEIFRVSSPARINAIGWTADSGAVLANRAGGFWKFPISGEEPLKLEVGLPNLGIHPDGRRIAYTAGGPAKPAEVWVLENFLPTQK